jgi:hypothetical protein
VYFKSIIIIVFFESILFANCVNIRLDQENGPLAHLPIYDQDNFGSCYAYTAAQLIDAYRYSHGFSENKILTSPLKITADSSTLLSYSENGGGKINDSLLEAKQQGSCNKDITDQLLSGRTEKQFFKKASRDLTKYDDEQLEYSNELKKQKDSLSFIKKLQIAFGIKTLPSRPISNVIKKIQCDLQASNLPRNIIPNFNDLEEIIRHASSWDAYYIRDLINKVCEKNLINLSELPNPTQIQFGIDSKMSLEERSKAVSSTINKLFIEKNPQPIGISFCSKTLFDQNYYGANRYEILSGSENCGNHGALIIGSKLLKSGKCKYLIRNS